MTRRAKSAAPTPKPEAVTIEVLTGNLWVVPHDGRDAVKVMRGETARVRREDAEAFFAARKVIILEKSNVAE